MTHDTGRTPATSGTPKPPMFTNLPARWPGWPSLRSSSPLPESGSSQVMYKQIHGELRLTDAVKTAADKESMCKEAVCQDLGTPNKIWLIYERAFGEPGTGKSAICGLFYYLFTHLNWWFSIARWSHQKVPTARYPTWEWRHKNYASWTWRHRTVSEPFLCLRTCS